MLGLRRRLRFSEKSLELGDALTNRGLSFHNRRRQGRVLVERGPLLLRGGHDIAEHVELQRGRRVDDVHAQPHEHLAQLVRALAASAPAVADNHGGLAVPLVEELVDGVLERRGVPPVVLGADEDECVLRRDGAAPLTGARVGVVVARGQARGLDGVLVLRELPVEEVERGDFQVAESVAALDLLLHEGGDGEAPAALPGAADDDGDAGFGACHCVCLAESAGFQTGWMG